MKNYSLWIKIAAAFQILTGLVHSISLFVNPEPATEDERKMIELMDTVKLNLGAGFHKTFADLFMDLSAHFTLAFLLGGIVNWYLASKKADAFILKGVLTINLVIFGLSFGLALVYTFLPPITFTGLTFLLLLIARINTGRATP